MLDNTPSTSVEAHQVHDHRSDLLQLLVQGLLVRLAERSSRLVRLHELYAPSRGPLYLQHLDSRPLVRVEFLELSPQHALVDLQGLDCSHERYS
jgi:hypothetical protein